MDMHGEQLYIQRGIHEVRGVMTEVSFTGIHGRKYVKKKIKKGRKAEWQKTPKTKQKKLRCVCVCCVPWSKESFRRYREGRWTRVGVGRMSEPVAHILIMWNDISSRGERERQRGDQEESINHFAHQHKSHFLQEIPLRVMRWTTLSANLVSALPVLVNWEFGNYKDLISISRLGWWIFKQPRYGFVPQGAITVSHQLNQLSPPHMHSQNNLPSWLKGNRWNLVHLGVAPQSVFNMSTTTVFSLFNQIILCLTCKTKLNKQMK